MPDWTTLARVKRHVNLDPSNDDLDDKIADLIPAASRMLEKYIGHDLFETEYTEYYDGDGTNEIILDHYPVVEIASIHDDLDREWGSDTELDVEDTVVSLNTEQNVGWLRLFRGTTSFQIGVQNVKVVYTAGYETLPEDAEMACVQLVAWLLNRSGSEGQAGASLGGKSETYETDSIPMYIKRMVAAYKKYAV